MTGRELAGRELADALHELDVRLTRRGKTPFSFAKPRYIEDPVSCYFYHMMDLPGFGTVGGQWDLRRDFDQYIGNFPLRNKTLLDIGCASGFLSFEAEKRSASVTSFDLDSASRQALLPFSRNLDFRRPMESIQQRDQWFDKWKNGYWLAHRLLDSRARVYYGDIYHLPEDLGLFDVVLVGSVLQHLCDPINALASIAKRAAGTLIINEPVLAHHEPIAAFQGKANVPTQNFTWWTYSLGTYREVLGMLGFTISSVTRAKYLHLVSGVPKPVEQATIIARRITDENLSRPAKSPATAEERK